MTYVKENKQLYPLSHRGTLKLHTTKYLHISLLTKNKQRRKYSSLTNQNIEEINIAGKIIIRKEKLHYEKQVI